jgi:hypothetical protein
MCMAWIGAYTYLVAWMLTLVPISCFSVSA